MRIQAIRYVLAGVSLILVQTHAQAQDCDYLSITATTWNRFTDNGDGTVTDTATGLQWMRCSYGQYWNGATCTGTATLQDHERALAFAGFANNLGYSDWRVPNLKELGSIVELACTVPAIDLSIFPGTLDSLYWSSSPVAGYPTTAWAVQFYDGSESAINPVLLPFRLVRGGPVLPLGDTPLNDTGIDWWTDGTASGLAFEPPGYLGQDASSGRDATDDDDTDGHAGFYFTKLDANGDPLPADAATWSCVRDEVTGRVWEIKTDDGGLRDRDWTYTWYNPDPTTNGGSSGIPGGTASPSGNCYDLARCDTAKFVADVNAAGLCGANDWGLPTREELRSIVDYSGVSPAVDSAWFPGTVANFQDDGYWSSSPWLPPIAGVGEGAWAVGFLDGQIGAHVSSAAIHVRLMRGGQALSVEHVGVWRPGNRRFYLDSSGNNRWDGTAGGDTLTAAFGTATDIPVTGDWNGDGVDEVGFWRPSNRKFYLDTNGNDRWDGTAGGDTLTFSFGTSTDIPVIGDWTGNGRDEVGVWRPSNRRFYLDSNGNKRWDGVAGGDTFTSPFGIASDIPVTGDWNGDGIDEGGVWRPSNRRFYLDANSNHQWDGPAGGDTLTFAFGTSTDIPITGDWDGDRGDEAGVWRPSNRRFYLDANGNDRWDGTAGGDTLTPAFGISSDLPVVGHW